MQNISCVIYYDFIIIHVEPISKNENINNKCVFIPEMTTEIFITHENHKELKPDYDCEMCSVICREIILLYPV